MRIPFLFLFLSCFVFSLSAQQAAPSPVSWMAVYQPISKQEGEVVIKAIIEKGWHTYSQRPTDAGPISTVISFKPSAQFELIGTTKENHVIEEYDKAFEARLYMFSDKAEFRQKVKLKSDPGFSIAFAIEFVACNDGMCLPPKTIDLNVRTQ